MGDEDMGVWELSEGWDRRPLGAIAPANASQIRPADFSERAFHYLGLDALPSSGWIEPSLQIVEGSEVRSNCIQFDARHVLYAKLRPYLNKVVVPTHNGVGSTEFVPLMPDTNIVTREFLAWYLRSPEFVEYAVRNSTGARMPRIRMPALWEAEIPLPPLAEQRRIVTRIKERLARIAEARRLRAIADQDAERLMAAAMREAFNFDGELPAGWEWRIVGEVGDTERVSVQTGPFGAQLKSSEFVDAGVPVLAIGNVQWGHLDISDLKYVRPQKADKLSRYRVRVGDILFTRMGTVGRSCIVPPEVDDWLISYHLLRVAVDKRQCDPQYLSYCFRGAPQIEEQIEQRSRGATRAGVNTTILTNLRFPAPALAEQRRIVAYLDGVQTQVTELKRLQAQSTAELGRLEGAILTRAFRGEL